MKVGSLLIILSLVSCASYQNGRTAKQSVNGKISEAPADIKVTAHYDNEYSTKHFSYLQVEFGNKSDEWKDITKVILNVEGDSIKIILGQRLDDWTRAIQNKVAVDRQNLQMALGVLAVGSAVAAGSSAQSGNYTNTAVFSTVMAGAAVASDVNRLTDSISDLERAQIFPKSHLYSPFSLPPGLVNKRWILIQHEKNVRVDNLSFDVFFKTGKKRTYTIGLNSYY
ncbi:MAG: hypothetical protein ACJAS4_002071 [Bacteriovoracaceae bacterium]|jgi:hypothetical protein